MSRVASFTHRDARASLNDTLKNFGLDKPEYHRRLNQFIWKRGRFTAEILFQFKCLLQDALEEVQTRERRKAAIATATNPNPTQPGA